MRCLQAAKACTHLAADKSDAADAEGQHVTVQVQPVFLEVQLGTQACTPQQAGACRFECPWSVAVEGEIPAHM